jgi:predicted secreted hydrolase
MALDSMRTLSRKHGRALLSALALLCAPQDSGWKRIEPGLTLVFPADHGAHPGYKTEWWYLTGHLEDEQGARFGFQFTIFRRGLDSREPREGELPLRAHDLYAGHLALTDVARGETRFAERLRSSSPLARAAQGELDLALEDWSLVRDEEGELKLAGADPARAFGLELLLRPTKPLVFHGEGGYSKKGGEPGNASAYVSWTRLALEGSLQLDGTRKTVHGSAWFDHEFGSSVLEEGVVGWDWFGLQLDDGRELMLFVLRGEAGEPSTASAATLVARDGTTLSLKSTEFTLHPTAAWKSPKSGASYPARWTIAIPAEGLELELTPLVANCELDSSATRVTYWEGPLEVRGGGKGGTVAGRGYAELTGYAGSMSGRF